MAARPVLEVMTAASVVLSWWRRRRCSFPGRPAWPARSRLSRGICARWGIRRMARVVSYPSSCGIMMSISTRSMSSAASSSMALRPSVARTLLTAGAADRVADEFRHRPAGSSIAHCGAPYYRCISCRELTAPRRSLRAVGPVIVQAPPSQSCPAGGDPARAPELGRTRCRTWDLVDCWLGGRAG
jgi:hypothetical protein